MFDHNELYPKQILIIISLIYSISTVPSWLCTDDDGETASQKSIFWFPKAMKH